MASSRYAKPIKTAGIRKEGKMMLREVRHDSARMTKAYPTVNVAAKKLASDEFTVCREPANVVSIVSMS
jgi:hypothetical protein